MRGGVSTIYPLLISTVKGGHILHRVALDTHHIVSQTVRKSVGRSFARQSPPPTSPVGAPLRFLLEAISPTQTFLLAVLLWCAP